MGLYDKTLGTLLVGIFFNTYLYGLVTYQFAAYWRTYFNDPLRIKLVVLFLFLVDTAHSISVIYMAWEYWSVLFAFLHGGCLSKICVSVTNFANPAALEVALWPYTFTPIATALAALATQIFLGYRICRLTGSRIIYVVIVLLAFTSFGLGMACGIRAWIISVLADLSVLNNLVTAWLSMQVGTDLLITGLLTFSLLRSKSGFRKTDNVLNRLVRGAIQTGVFAGIFSLSDLATFLQYPDTNMYGMFAIPIGRIYTNTLLDTLISRDELRARLTGTMSIDRTVIYGLLLTGGHS
ncbi:hypothetical protein EWM64_g531 [Hericium alpestre]|uniref:DUF6534 domain-containing protein n=1 Tax=Hericium alpestre TaxID=135208 RepID=A0A4Z0ABS9_9AGAM|nr:hypothetical protein EWM64_g531 [Hericium alpestre]